MAQQTSEPLSSAASEELPLLVPPLTLRSDVTSPLLAKETSQPLYLEQGQTQSDLELVTESTTVTTTQALEASPFVPFQGLLVSRIQSSSVVSVIKSLPFGTFASMPPLTAVPLHPGLLVEESPASQAQHLMALAQRLRGMAFALDPTSVISFLPTSEVLVQPTIAL